MKVFVSGMEKVLLISLYMLVGWPIDNNNIGGNICDGLFASQLWFLYIFI